jgi:hypothetical protein
MSYFIKKKKMSLNYDAFFSFSFSILIVSVADFKFHSHCPTNYRIIVLPVARNCFAEEYKASALSSAAPVKVTVVLVKVKGEFACATAD